VVDGAWDSKKSMPLRNNSIRGISLLDRSICHVPQLHGTCTVHASFREQSDSQGSPGQHGVPTSAIPVPCSSAKLWAGQSAKLEAWEGLARLRRSGGEQTAASLDRCRVLGKITDRRAGGVCSSSLTANKRPAHHHEQNLSGRPING
jgi:hypothetical protein